MTGLLGSSLILIILSSFPSHARLAKGNQTIFQNFSRRWWNWVWQKEKRKWLWRRKHCCWHFSCTVSIVWYELDHFKFRWNRSLSGRLARKLATYFESWVESADKFILVASLPFISISFSNSYIKGKKKSALCDHTKKDHRFSVVTLNGRILCWVLPQKTTLCVRANVGSFHTLEEGKEGRCCDFLKHCDQFGIAYNLWSHSTAYFFFILILVDNEAVICVSIMVPLKTQMWKQELGVSFLGKNST